MEQQRTFYMWTYIWHVLRNLSPKNYLAQKCGELYRPFLFLFYGTVNYQFFRAIKKRGEIFNTVLSIGNVFDRQRHGITWTAWWLVRPHLILHRRNILVRNEIYLEFQWSMKIRLNKCSTKPYNILHIFQFIVRFTKSV